jgi:hypothetical protein
MSADRLDQVIDDVLDRVASPGDRAWLEARRASDPMARERFSARRELFRALDTTGMREAPAALLPAVLREIADAGRLPTPGPARGTTTPARGPVAWLERISRAGARPALAWGYAAVAVAVVAALILVARTPSGRPDWRPVAGTIGAAESGARLGAVTLMAADARLVATAFAGGGSRVQLVLEVTPGPRSRAEVTIAVDPAHARLLPTAGTAEPGSGWVATPERFTARFERNTVIRLELTRDESGPVPVSIRLQSPTGIDTRVLQLGPGAPGR